MFTSLRRFAPWQQFFWLAIWKTVLFSASVSYLLTEVDPLQWLPFGHAAHGCFGTVSCSQLRSSGLVTFPFSSQTAKSLQPAITRHGWCVFNCRLPLSHAKAWHQQLFYHFIIQRSVQKSMPALSNSSAFFSLQPVWEKASSLCSSCVCRHVFYAGTHRLSPGVFVGTQIVLPEAGIWSTLYFIAVFESDYHCTWSKHYEVIEKTKHPGAKAMTLFYYIQILQRMWEWTKIRIIRFLSAFWSGETNSGQYPFWGCRYNRRITVESSLV